MVSKHWAHPTQPRLTWSCSSSCCLFQRWDCSRHALPQASSFSPFSHNDYPRLKPDHTSAELKLRVVSGGPLQSTSFLDGVCNRPLKQNLISDLALLLCSLRGVSLMASWLLPFPHSVETSCLNWPWKQPSKSIIYRSKMAWSPSWPLNMGVRLRLNPCLSYTKENYFCSFFIFYFVCLCVCNRVLPYSPGWPQSLASTFQCWNYSLVQPATLGKRNLWTFCLALRRLTEMDWGVLPAACIPSHAPEPPECPLCTQRPFSPVPSPSSMRLCWLSCWGL